MALQLTVSDLIRDVRSVLDEDNKSRVSDTEDILPALNRAQVRAVSILAKHYPEPLLKSQSVTPVNSRYPIPRDAFEDRVLRVQIVIGGFYYHMTNISYRDVSSIATTIPGTTPLYYYVKGKDIEILPAGTSPYPLEIFYVKTPLTLSKELCQISKVGPTYLVVNDASGLSVGSYVNSIDHRTGELIGQLQIKKITGNKIEFRDTPDRDIVNQDPVVALSSLLTSTDPTAEVLKEDDYLCPSGCSNIPYMNGAMTNFYTAFTEGEIRRKLGEETELQDRAMNEFENEVKRTWAGRETTLRVSNRGRAWRTNSIRAWRGR